MGSLSLTQEQTAYVTQQLGVLMQFAFGLSGCDLTQYFGLSRHIAQDGQNAAVAVDEPVPHGSRDLRERSSAGRRR